MESKKIVCAKWIGRFGNQCFSYLYGKHISNQFGLDFYIPTEWEGSVLFKDPAPVVDDWFPIEAFVPHDNFATFDESFAQNKKLISEHNKMTGDTIELIDPNLFENYGKLNVTYSSLVTDRPWFYNLLSLRELKSYFQFSEAVKNSEVFRELSKRKGTYDIAHFRRTDIAAKGYSGGHSIVSLESYWRAFDEYGADREAMLWVSDEKMIGWKWEGAPPIISGVSIPWLPDFLKLLFARKIFRANSAFSQWAGWWGDAEVFSPVLDKFAPGEVVDVEFTRGNHPHWMGVKGEHSCYEFRLKDEKNHSNMSIDKKKNQILMLHWNGRFGNRMFSYLFGRNFAQAHNLEFAIPSEWEGSVLFKDQDHTVVEDEELRLRLNQTDPAMDNLKFRMEAVRDYCSRTEGHFELMKPDQLATYNSKSVCFDSLCVGNSEVFASYSRERILRWFAWSDEVRNLDVYKYFEDIQGTYDIAHLRRGDISDPNYNKNNPQAYSVISKESYTKAFKKFGFDSDQIIWSSDDVTGKWVKNNETSFGGWSYPFGSHRVPNVIFDWLPDFLRLYFARNIFRSNSSFSWWAGFLSSSATLYSPVLSERKVYRGTGDEIECDFVKGNHPHWLYTSHDKTCNEIHIPD